MIKMSFSTPAPLTIVESVHIFLFFFSLDNMLPSLSKKKINLVHTNSNNNITARITEIIIFVIDKLIFAHRLRIYYHLLYKAHSNKNQGVLIRILESTLYLNDAYVSN